MRPSSRAFPLILVIMSTMVGALRAETPVSTPDPVSADHQLMNDFIEQMVREAIPVEYENHKHWGKTKDVVVGLRVDRSGRWPQFDKRRKTVQHGTWKAYRVRLIDPQNTLHFSLGPPRAAPEGGMRVDIQAIADLEVFGRLAEWCYDVQLFSVNAQAIARVKFEATCDIQLLIDPQHTPPDVLIRPIVRDARVELQKFELQRVSQLNGAAAQELGENLEPVLNEVLEQKREKLIERLNRQITRKQEKLRLSLHDAATSMWRDAFISEPTK